MDDIKISSNKSFGIVFFIVFLLIALYPLLYGEDFRVWSLLISIGFLMTFSKFYFVFSLILFLQLFFFQVHSLDVDKPKDCIKRFKSNNILGFLVFINILIGKLL